MFLYQTLLLSNDIQDINTCSEHVLDTFFSRTKKSILSRFTYINLKIETPHKKRKNRSVPLHLFCLHNLQNHRLQKKTGCIDINVIHNSGPSINLLSVTLAKNTILTCILYNWMDGERGGGQYDPRKETQFY